MEMSTPDKPEVMRLARKLCVDRDLIIGKLFRLWSWFDANSNDGVVDGVVDADVDTLIGIDGFCAALKDVNWFGSDQQQEKAWLPNFDRHNGETAKKRASKNRRQTRWRQGKDASVDDAASTEATTREEKRREEKKEDKTLGTSADADGAERDDGKPKNARYEYPEEFEQAWSAYPNREGPNNKRQAFKAWKARRREGVTAEEMLAGVQRYAGHLRTTGRIGTAYVKQASTFFGPDAHYADDYEGNAPSANIWRDAV